jgi:hypothetical protein
MLKILSTKCYNKNGFETEESKCVAKHIEKEDGINKYYVKAYGKTLYDVQNAEPLYHKRHPWKLVQVNQECFDLYMNFLKHGRRRYLSTAERNVKV